MKEEMEVEDEEEKKGVVGGGEEMKRKRRGVEGERRKIMKGRKRGKKVPPTIRTLYHLPAPKVGGHSDASRRDMSPSDPTPR